MSLFRIQPVSILCLWLPLGLLIAQVIVEATVPRPIVNAMVSENGMYEILQFLVIGGAFVWAVCLLRLKSLQASKWVWRWIALAAVCALYVAGEEISWGQHIFDWTTSDNWAAVNDQNETNLHNTSSWLDQKPRVLLEIGVYVGGIIIPVLMRVRKNLLPEKFAVIYPTIALMPTALMLLLLRILTEVQDAGGAAYFARISELKETWMYYFVFLYIALMSQRFKGQAKTDETA